MAEMGKYLYCIIPCQEVRNFDTIAIGSKDNVVHTVPHNGLAAVVSDSPAKQYESTRQNMVAHERVLETVMREFALLPVRFGTVTDFTSPIPDIQKLLGSRSAEFEKLLREIKDKVELGLKAFWRDETAIFEEIVAENTDIRRLRNSLAGKSPEATHFDRIHLGEMVKEALNLKRAREASKILQPLRRVAHSIRENEVLGDRMVVNAAFLVAKTKEPEFDQVVSKLDAQFGERLSLKYIGLAPPYNFVNIVVDWKELD
jgi:hypothetical protein